MMSPGPGPVSARILHTGCRSMTEGVPVLQVDPVSKCILHTGCVQEGEKKRLQIESKPGQINPVHVQEDMEHAKINQRWIHAREHAELC